MTVSWKPDVFSAADKAAFSVRERSGEKSTVGQIAHGRATLTKAALGASGLGCIVDPVVGRHRPYRHTFRFRPPLFAGERVRELWHNSSRNRICRSISWSVCGAWLVGLGLALLIGVPLGLAVGSYSMLNAATSPAFQFLRMISPLSWMPIAVMVFGVGDRPIYFLLTFAAVWPILLSTAEGVTRLEPSWLRLASSLSATRWETLFHVIVPGVLGHVLIGLRLAIGIVWIVLVPCEMLGVSAGLGYFILDTRDRLAYSELMAIVLIIGLLGFLLDAGARGLHRMFGRNR